MKKLTPLEIENRSINKIIIKLKKMSRKYPQNHLRLACSRYATKERESIRLMREISQREKELNELRKSKK